MKKQINLEKNLYKQKYQSFFDYLDEHLNNLSYKLCFRKNKVSTIVTITYDFKQNENIENIEDINFEHHIKNIELPPNLTVIQPYGHKLIISKYPQERLPDNLKVSIMIIKNSPKLHYFGKNTIISQQLIAKRSYLKNLDNIKVKYSDINLRSAYLIEKLPDNFKCLNLNISESSIKKLGKNTIIKNSLIANQSSIEELPDKLYIGSSLNLNKSKIKKMGKNIFVGRNVYILDTNSLTELGKKMFIGGNLDMQYSNIERINNIFIGGYLIAYNSLLVELGENIFINKYINNFWVNYLQKKDKNEYHFTTNKIKKGICEISNTKINKLPISLLHSNKKVIINGLFIKNIEKFNILEPKRKTPPKIIKQFDNYITTKKSIYNKEIRFFKKWESQQELELFYKNHLLYNFKIPIQKKLLLEQFDKITQNEIKKYINTTNNSVSIINKNQNIKNKKQANIKINQSFNEINFRLIDYCRSKEAFEFLYKNGYHFTEKEYNLIQDLNIKNLYEMYLLKSM